MESKFQTSFIPKKSSDDGRVRVKTPYNLFSIIAIFIIVISLIVAGGIFAYKFILKNRIEAAKQTLVTKEAEFNYGAVEEIVRLDKQLMAADKLLKEHTAVSGLFKVLEENTVRNLRFSSFEFSYFSPTKVALIMKGEARTFGAVARQAEFFAAASSTKAYFKDPIFSDLDVNERGDVSFSFLTTIDPSLINYQP